ncbi:MAG TPA: DUF1634 domain-containing protein [Terracidiphilus sp.]|nr:DUF1634 domain-containing protein [Terracidiphilus sp.]
MDDRRLESIIGQLLRAGVLVAAATVLIGGALYLAGHHAEPASYHTFHAAGSNIRSLSGIAIGVAHGDSVAIMQLGLLLLVLTPIARVVTAVVGFLLERDLMYAVISAIVLAILMFSLVHAS